jgi:hypothetical protein
MRASVEKASSGKPGEAFVLLAFVHPDRVAGTVDRPAAKRRSP